MAARKALNAQQKKSLADFRQSIGGADEIKLKRHQEFLSARQAIRQALEKQPDTVPSLAESLHLPSGEVLWHIAAMRKYGQVREFGEMGGYIRYGLVASEPQKKD
jgi:hypothetical protein